MDCSEFIARFSEYYDRRTQDDAAGPMEAHLETCDSCRRYHRVVSQAGQLLRSLPRPSVSADFRPRLQHRIYHVEDERVLPSSSGSGVTATTALAMAVLVAFAAWTPAMRSGASEPAQDPELAASLDGTPAPTGPDPAELFQPTSVLQVRHAQDGGLWTQTHTHSLLYEYSLLSRERPRATVQIRQTGLE